jgi:hypothetical protein
VKIILFWIVGVLAYALTSEEIAKKNELQTRGAKSSIASVVMHLINAQGDRSSRQMILKTLELDEGDYSLSIFLSPADIRGTKFLTYEYMDSDDDRWLYLPAIKRIKRIASKNRSGAFLGSEFSYEDIGIPSYKKFHYDTKVEEVSCANSHCFKITRFPNEKNSGYTKQVNLIDQTTFLIFQSDYYNERDEVYKTAYFSDYKQINGLYRFGKIVMHNHESEKRTELIWNEETIDAKLTKKDFKKRLLKNGRVDY